MAKGYLIGELTVPDMEAYRASGYMAQAEAAIAAHGGRYLVRGGDPAALEGGPPGRIVVLEFPSRAEAERFYHSEQYAAPKALRHRLSSGRLWLLDGYDPG